MSALLRLLRHVWLDADDARRIIDASALQRLEARVRDSEKLHTGEICVCVEASLPMRDLWRHLRGAPLDAVVRERALAVFGELRVWDTELNNGVLIYMLLAEHRVEIVADRAVARVADEERLRRVLAGIAGDLRAGRHEEGLGRAIEAIGEVLRQHFPLAGDATEGRADEDELPNRPLLR